MTDMRAHTWTDSDYQDWLADLGPHDCMLNQNVDMEWAVYQFVPPRGFRSVALGFKKLDQAVEKAEEEGLAIQAVNPHTRITTLDGPSRFAPAHEDERD